MPKINFLYIQFISQSYVPGLIIDSKTKIDMDDFRKSMNHYSKGGDDNYDRLEYLGDAIFHMVISDYLFQRYDDENGGFLTKIRIAIEKGESMAMMARELKMEEYIQIGKGSITDDIVEDVFEAFLGAFYINFKYVHTKTLIINIIEKYKDIAALIHNDDNYKSLLLAYYHQMNWGHPIYESKPTNDKGTYKIVIRNPEKVILGKASFASRKEAEQMAAKDALVNLKVIVDGEIDYDWIDKIDKVEKVEKTEKKATQPIHNSNNVLIDKNDVSDMLTGYGMIINKSKIQIKTFQESMTHVSYVKRTKLTDTDKALSKTCASLQKSWYGRLRFLGDSVIHFIIGEFLFNRFVDKEEGFLTELRSKLENRESLYALSKKTGIDNYILISSNIESLHGRNNVNIMSQGFEAFVAAVYLCLGFSDAREFLINVIKKEVDLDKIMSGNENYKEIVSVFCTQRGIQPPTYKILEEHGPDHMKEFTMGIYCKGKLVGKGKAASKLKAEQLAAKMMFDRNIK